jgi:hypothetical protein
MPDGSDRPGTISHWCQTTYGYSKVIFAAPFIYALPMP